MSKQFFKKNEDNSYCLKSTNRYVIYSVNHDKVTAPITKMFGRKGWIIAYSDHGLESTMADMKFRYGKTLEEVKSILDNTLTLRANAMTKEPATTSPSSETYSAWSA